MAIQLLMAFLSAEVSNRELMRAATPHGPSDTGRCQECEQDPSSAQEERDLVRYAILSAILIAFCLNSQPGKKVPYLHLKEKGANRKITNSRLQVNCKKQRCTRQDDKPAQAKHSVIFSGSVTPR